MKIRFLATHKALIGLSFVAVLSGCSGNTYGTGVGSNKQLMDDMTGIVTFDTSKEKKRIDYSARPALIKPHTVAGLPTPAEKVQAESGYFPEDPETKRARMLAELENSDDANIAAEKLSPEMLALREESLARSKYTDPKKKRMMENDDGDCYLCDYYERMEIDNNRVATKTAERQQSVYKRKYLTQPPDEYRTPAETAEAGLVGEKETTDGNGVKKKKKRWDGGLFE